MTRTARIWLVLAVLYAAFFGWYTSFGGPLTEEEIARYMAFLEESGNSEVPLETWRHFMETDTGDDFVMWNVALLYDTPEPIDGAEPGETSMQVVERYFEPFFARALPRASHPISNGEAASPPVDLSGVDGAETWDFGTAVRYRSRRDLMEQAVDISPSGIHRFKVAAVEKTIAFPLDPWFHIGDPRILLAMALVIVGQALQLRLAARR